MIVDRESFTEKAKIFLITNWWLLWLFIAVSSTINVFIYFDMNKKFERVLAIVEKNSKGVSMLTYAGTPVYNEKQIIDIQDENFKKAVRSILQRYLIIDSSRLTKNFTDIPSSMEDIYNKNEDISDFNVHYLKAKEDKQAFNFMKEHLKVLLSLLKSDNLPETITLLKSRTDKYEVIDNKFNIVVFADVKLDYFLTESNSWERKLGALKIEASGLFDSTNGDAFNPLGIKINTFKVTYPKKREK